MSAGASGAKSCRAATIATAPPVRAVLDGNEAAEIGHEDTLAVPRIGLDNVATLV
jgi:hypothetical protein